jgi:hypothetical protein
LRVVVVVVVVGVVVDLFPSLNEDTSRLGHSLSPTPLFPMSIEQAPHDLNWATHHLISHSGCGDDFIMYLFYFIYYLLCYIIIIIIIIYF